MINDCYSYFGLYSNHDIHESMIKDKIRTESYKLAFEKNQNLFKGKTVLDVGCGTGLLSFFAANAGAAKVYAVENADIAKYTSKIVESNGFSNVISVIKGKIEEIELPVDKVDIIISEWMGYFLLFESMVDSIIYARDKWLNKETGLILPDRFAINIALLHDSNFNKKIGFWDSVYGVDMSIIKKLVISDAIVCLCNSNSINSSVTKLYEMNLYTITKQELSFSAEYNLKILRKDKLNAVVCWFDVFFYERLLFPVSFTTSPFNTPTHWKQTLLYFPNEIQVDEGDSIQGSIAVVRSNTNFRELNIILSAYRTNVFSETSQKILKRYYKLK